MPPRLPLYHIIENDLKNKIHSGQYCPGDVLPSERELTEIYKVSRLTAREAVNRLSIQGLVEKIQGKGTFVTKPKINHRMGYLHHGGQEVLTSFYEIRTEVLDLKVIEPSEMVFNNLELKEKGSKVIYLERLRYANETPAAIIKSYLPHQYVPGMETIDFTNKSLYSILESTYRIQLHDAQEIMEAVTANTKSSDLLKIKRGTALLFNQRIARLIDGTVIEYETIESRSDIYKYHSDLVGIKKQNVVKF